MASGKKQRTRVRQVLVACLMALAGAVGVDGPRARAQARPSVTLAPALQLDARSLELFAPDGGGRRRERAVGYLLPWRDPARRRGAMFTSLSHRFGPEPRFGVVRHVADTRLGWLHRTGAGVATAVSLRASVFAPDALQPLPESLALEQTQVLMLEAITTLDRRDRVRSPRRGVYLRASLQQAGLGGASSWDYLRATLDLRGYLPLGGRAVLAARFAAGALVMFESHDIDAPALYELDALGPLSEQLEAGGISSHRGYRRGGLGATRRGVAGAPGTDGSAARHRPVLIAGGTRRWEGSLELRMRIGGKLGSVLFVDAGNVSRRSELELGVLNLAAGFGLRYRTRLGMLRAEWAFRPEALQRAGGRARRGEPRACADGQDVDCRPAPTLLGSIPGAFHLAFAEPF